MRIKSSRARVIIGTAATLSMLIGMGCPQLSMAQAADPDLAVQSVAEGEADLDAASEPAIAEAEAVSTENQTYLLDTESVSKSRVVSSSASRQLVGKMASAVKYKQGVPCVPLMLVDDPNTLIVCDRDAIMRAEKRTITLSRGKGVYMVGKQPIIVETPLGTVTIPGNSAAIIEQAENGLLRVDHLTGASTRVTVKRWKGIKTYEAAVGDEICLAPKGLAPDLLVPKDGVERQEISSEVGDAGIMLAENKFAPKTMLEKECLLQCDSNSFFQVRRKVYNLRQSIDAQTGDDLVGTGCGTAKGEPMPMMLLAGEEQAPQLKPVNLSEAVNTQIVLLHKATNSALVKYNDRSNIAFDHPSVTELKSGEAVFSSFDTTFVKTPHSMIKIDPGALILVSVSDDVTKLRTLWENRKNSVCQSIGKKPFYVLAGDESLASDELRSIYLTASKDMVGRRLTHYSELQDGKVIHFSEVSLMSLAQSSDLLAQLMNSNDPVDQAVMRKVNKMAAILVQISASHGLYELMQPPQWRRDSKSSSLMPVLY